MYAPVVLSACVVHKVCVAFVQVEVSWHCGRAETDGVASNAVKVPLML